MENELLEKVVTAYIELSQKTIDFLLADRSMPPSPKFTLEDRIEAEDIVDFEDVPRDEFHELQDAVNDRFSDGFLVDGEDDETPIS